MHQRPEFEEGMDWVEPIGVYCAGERLWISEPYEIIIHCALVIEIPPDLDITPRGIESQEIATQEEREKTALTASYMSIAQVPDNPTELPQVADTEPDESLAKVMLLGSEAEALVAPPQPQAPASITDLLAQIAVPAADGAPGLFSGQQQMAADPAVMQQYLSQLASYGFGGLAQGAAGPAGTGVGVGAAPPLPYGQGPPQQHQQQLPYGDYTQYPHPENDQSHGWGGLPAPSGYGQGWDEDGYNVPGGSGNIDRGGGGGGPKRGRGRRGGFGDQGWRGRGRGRGGGGGGRSRQLCNFFAQGK